MSLGAVIPGILVLVCFWRLEARGWGLEAGGQRLGAGADTGLEARGRLEVGSWRLVGDEAAARRLGYNQQVRSIPDD
jgi:hypothetical protein